jgi:hypothetical protein
VEASVPEAFDVAAVRHWRDGVLLEGESRLSNSNQLFGFAAECAIKAALVALPGFIDANHELMNRYREHIDVLWDRVHLQGIQKRFPALVAVLRADNPFHDWTTDHRYAHDEVGAPAARIRHRDTAKRLIGAVGLLGVRAGATQ